MVSSLETIRIRPHEESQEVEDSGKAEKARVDSGGDSKALQPFGGPGKETYQRLAAGILIHSASQILPLSGMTVL